MQPALLFGGFLQRFWRQNFRNEGSQNDNQIPILIVIACTTWSSTDPFEG